MSRSLSSPLVQADDNPDDMTFHRFEEIAAWQTGRKLVRAIYQVSSQGAFSKDYGLRDQIRRAAISMTANIAEGVSRRSDKEFVQFLFTAKASGAEIQSHLYVALDLGYLNQATFTDLFAWTERFARQVSGLISYLTSRKDRARLLHAQRHHQDRVDREDRVDVVEQVDRADREDRADRGDRVGHDYS